MTVDDNMFAEGNCAYHKTPIMINALGVLWMIFAILIVPRVATIVVTALSAGMRFIKKRVKVLWREKVKDHLAIPMHAAIPMKRVHSHELEDSDSDREAMDEPDSKPKRETQRKLEIAGENIEEVCPEKERESVTCKSRIREACSDVMSVITTEIDYNLLTLSIGVLQMTAFGIQLYIDLSNLDIEHLGVSWHEYQCGEMVLLNSPNFKYALVILAIKAGKLGKFPTDGITHKILWTIESFVCTSYIAMLCVPIAMTHLVPGSIIFAWFSVPVGAFVRFGVFLEKHDKLNNPFAIFCALTFYSVLAAVSIPLLYEMTSRQYSGMTYKQSVWLSHESRLMMNWDPAMETCAEKFSTIWTFW